jgi:hypothetical protein
MMEPGPVTPDEKAIFESARHHFLRVNSQGSSRLSVSTSLTGLTFAAFAALLVGPGGTPGAPLTADQAVVTAVRVLTSIASLLFLLTAASTFAALQLLANVSPSASKSLGEGTPRGLDQRDVRRLQDAYTIFMAPSHWIPWGLVVLMLTFPVIAWHAYLLLGVGTLILMLFLAWCLRHLIGVAVDGLLRRPQ